MKASFSWLRDYVDIKMTVEDLAEMLTMSGIHVEQLEGMGGDYVFEFEITSNRPDCLSIIGIAREIAAITGKKLKVPNTLMSKSQFPMSNKLPISNVQIKIEDKKLCSRYTARIVTDVKIEPSPKGVQNKLASIGLRPVNNIVDITNFVLMETGQPMHAFDLDKIKGNVHIRKARKGETIKTIDGIARALDEETLVIADDESPIAIAGVMGGLDTEVSENTKNILLESAYFDPVSVRRTSRKLGLSSESSYRFERKVDLDMVLMASERASSMITDIAGGKRGMFIDAGSKTPPLKSIKFNPKKSDRILGVNIPLKTKKDILNTLGFSVKGSGNNLEIKIPGFRRDISQEVDITEEIARVYGYNRIPETIPKIVGHTSVMDKEDIVKREIRKILSSMGLNEIMTYNLVSRNMLDEFGADKDALVFIKNPLSSEQEVLTQSLIPGMLKIINWNMNRKNKDLYLFELGNVYRKTGKKKFIEEPRLSIGITGLAEDAWFAEKRKATFFDLKGIAANLFEKLGIEKVNFIPADKTPCFSAASSMQYSNRGIGSIGRIDDKVLRKFDIEEDVYALEVSLEELLKDAVLEKRFKPIPKFPSIIHDISLVADKNIPAEAISGAIREIDSDIVKEVALIDMYKGKQIPEGKKGLLYRIEYRDDSRTLTDKEVEELHNRIKDNLSKKLGVTFR